MILCSHETNDENVQVSLANQAVGFSQKTGKPGMNVLLTKQIGEQTYVFATGQLEIRIAQKLYADDRDYDVWKLDGFTVLNSPLRIDHLATKFMTKKRFALSKRSPRVPLRDNRLLVILESLIFYDTLNVA
ncbi:MULTISPECIES: hypothetical protein [Lysinibacillus]|uniref:Uncharacterized protein n=1 Tax=Lysinibacillus capsici TaxID=2115968 RepID=A0ABY8KH50_9BACI|nr:hypothetical protein [Lysinibacillus capsici]WGF37758.1 hypothetical protein QBO96_18885 [Lysinibacillus capsici]